MCNSSSATAAAVVMSEVVQDVRKPIEIEMIKHTEKTSMTHFLIAREKWRNEALAVESCLGRGQ